MNFTEVNIKAIWTSKIFWMQVLSVLGIVGTAFGFDLTDADQVAILGGGGVLVNIVTIVLRVFSKAVTPTAANAL